MKKQMQAFLVLLAMVLAGYSAGLRAEDTDIYVDNAATAGIPNILFVMDTGANFSSSASSPCTAYSTQSGGGSPSLGNTAGGIEQCAMVNAISALPDGTVNIGIMVNNGNGFATDVRSTSDAAYHEACQGTYGGCLVRKLTLMDSAGKASMVRFIKSWKADSSANTASEFAVKSGGDRTANTMQESWAYYNGKVGMSGKNYGTSLLGTGCQKNFVVFIGNAFNNSGTPGDGGSSSPGGEAGGAMADAQVGASAAQRIKISETVTFNSATCGASSAAPSTSASNWSENWADEWARLMYEQDGGTISQTTSQNIITYTIGVVDDTSCKVDYPALLSTMAKYGGGKYFKTSNATDLTAAVATILNEVQAVNSVFSSASLPVSVNAQGTFLNQIFLGMFRPDSSAAPRWLGNLKQYQLVRNSSGQLVMGDKNGNSAISSAGTGFLSPSAVSIWTDKLTTAPDDAATGGFFKNAPLGTPATAFDSPDGEVVEKGGVAQQMRLENLTSTFDGAMGSGNPRRLYTYCPSGLSCSNLLTAAGNEFSTANTGISAAAFGDSTTVPIFSIVRSGTSATVTTSSNHGFTTGTVVSISNSNQTEYNVSQTAVTVSGSTTFTISGLPDRPTSPSQGAYTISKTGSTSTPITTLTRATSTSGSPANELVTVTTSAAHGFSGGNSVKIAGVTPTEYNGNVTLASGSGTTLTFNTPIYPVSPGVNVYKVVHAPYTRNISNITVVGNGSGAVTTVNTTGNHGFHANQYVRIVNASDTKYNTTSDLKILAVPTLTSFTIASIGGAGDSSGGSVSPSSVAQTVTSMTRTGSTVSATATAVVGTSDWFATGDVVNVSTTGTSPNETAYVASNAIITCGSGCTQLAYAIATSPSTPGTTFGTVSTPTPSITVAAGSVTRNGTTATVTSLTGGLAFANGDRVDVSPSGSAFSGESAYVGTWTVSCPVSCNLMSFGPVTQTPVTTATGTNMQAYASGSAPDRDTVIKWIRGLGLNSRDEKGPGSPVTVRGSIHGDVLHSRPVVVNYGDSRGIVAFYGANDGVFRAVNGNVTGNISSVPPGGELWGLLLPEHFGHYNRLLQNSPELKFPSTILTTAAAKDYFVDGPTGVFQQIDSTGKISKANLFLTMRRGGRFLYALDVTQPASPQHMWKKTFADTGYSELGQTWSRPRLTILQNITKTVGTVVSPKPVLVFGAGYDPAQDSEPPTTNTMGRGIYVVDPTDGSIIWSASSSCGTSTATCLQVPGMKWAIASDVTFIDRDNDGKTDKLYFADLGGNVWRADVDNASTLSWTVTRVAALGCDDGNDPNPSCSDGKAPRKFFFPPSVLSVKAAGVTGSYDALSISSGDREHPLKSTAAASSYNVVDRFFLVKDAGTALGTPTTANVKFSNLVAVNSNSTLYDGTGNGFYITFATGEKSVNAPLAVGGSIFFSTNRPVDRDATCAANLGQAKAYAVNPFDGFKVTNILSGGGLPPSAVAGLVNIVTTTTVGGVTTSKTTVEKFCIGCGISGSALNGTPPPSGSDGSSGSSTAPCTSALENCNASKTIAKKLKRTYWYKK